MAPKASVSPEPDDLYGSSPAPPSRSRRNTNAGPSLSPSPALSISSDKENRSSRPVDKGKGRAPMGPPSSSSTQAKRKRTLDQNSIDRNQRRRTIEVDENQNGPEVDDYDPDQDIEERRKVRGGLRDLSRTLNENRANYLAPASTGLRDILLKANDISNKVKQTSDATIDSRLLVNTAELSYKKTLALISGDTSQGIDIEDFISRCKGYMHRGDLEDGPASQVTSSTQRRRNQNAHDEDAEDNDDMLKWEYLGRNACLPNISRPSLPGFLLGPLSLEKRARKTVIRKAAFKPSNLQETQPEVLKAGDIERAENENLTTLCTQILTRFRKISTDIMEAAGDEQDELERTLGRELTNGEAVELLDRHKVSDSGGIDFFYFVINPDSFGQTIENIFYVSFLIRDGKFKIEVDSKDMPHLVEPDEEEQQRSKAESGAKKSQSVVAIDMEQWEELIELYEIKKSCILHRKETNVSSVGSKGWYA